MVIGRRNVRPWEGIDREIGEVLRPVVGEIVDDAMARILDEQPTLGGDVVGRFGETLRRGIDEAMAHFVDLLGTPEAALDGQLLELYHSFGAREDRHGRPLDALLAAYRLGARTAWGHFSREVIRAGVATEQIVLLAEALFAYIDELSSASALGFSRGQVARAGVRDVARRRLVEALTAGQAATAPASVHQLAAEADWVIPDRLAVAIVAHGAGAEPTPEGTVPRPRSASVHSPLVAGRVPPELAGDLLVLATDEELLVVVAEALAGRLGEGSVRALVAPGDRAYIGTVRPPAEAQISLAHARAIQQLVAVGILDGDVVVPAGDHLAELLLHADEQLFSDLSAQVLAPLRRLTSPRREVALDTLGAWFRHLGDRGAVAAELGVHPQTVSYRWSQLAELFGGRLDDPDTRFAISLAVHGHVRDRGVRGAVAASALAER